jgi:hypothetical protein
MTYLPELRESLVKAAGQQSADARRVRRGLGRRLPGSLGFVGLAVGSVVAIAVAVLALVLAGHKSTSPSRTTAAAPTLRVGRAASMAAARSLLVQFRPPAGAVPSASDPAPRWLSRPDDATFPGTVDIHRFFRIHGSPDGVMAAIRRSNPMLLRGESSASSAGQASASGGRTAQTETVLTSANYELPADGLVLRQLNIMVATARAGESAVRVDAQALWSPPRPPELLIPDRTTAIVVRATGVSPPAARFNRVDAPRQVALVVRFLNSLPALAPPHPICGGARIELTFTTHAASPLAVAVLHPSCGLVELALPGKSSILLTWMTPPAPLRPQLLVAALEALIGTA